MKRTVFISLAILMLVFLAACGIAEVPESPETTTAESATTTLSEETKNTSSTEQTPTAESTEATVPTEATGTSSETEDESEEINFAEQLVVDNENCLIKVTGIENDSIWGYTLKVQLENKSSDKTFMYSVESASVNGVEVAPLFATEVAPGKKAIDDIVFSGENINEEIIGTFTDIELNFRVYDSNDWMADDVAQASTRVYPLGEEQATRFSREAQLEDNVILDNDYATVIVTGYEVDSIWGYSANIFIVNKSEKNIMFSIEEASVNGFMADPFFADCIRAGNCGFNSVSWSDATLEELGITEVETIEFNLRAYDNDDWFADDLANDTIILNP